MKKKSLMKGMTGSAIGLTTLGVTTGIGGTVIGAAGGNPAVMTGFTSMLPAMSTAMGGGYAIQALGGLKTNTRKRRRR